MNKFNKSIILSIISLFICLNVNAEEFQLSYSKEGKKCVDYLRKGGHHNRNGALSSTSTGLLGLATITGAVLTAPTIIGPIFIGYFGGAATVTNGAHAGQELALSKNIKKRGKLIKSSYIVLGLHQKNETGKKKSIKRLKHYQKKIIKKFPKTTITYFDIATQFARANEAGYFCKVNLFIEKPRMEFLGQNDIGKYYGHENSNKHKLFANGKIEPISDKAIEHFHETLENYFQAIENEKEEIQLAEQKRLEEEKNAEHYRLEEEANFENDYFN